MKKIIILITALLSFSVAAEGEGKHEMHAFYFMNVSKLFLTLTERAVTPDF